MDANGWEEDLIGRPLPDPEPMSMLYGWLISPDESDHICEGHFSRYSCDGCGTHLAGNRYCYIGIPPNSCPRCDDAILGPVWGPDGLCRDCYEDLIPSPYCQHGTYIGGPSGPDYLCGACEMGY